MRALLIILFICLSSLIGCHAGDKDDLAALSRSANELLVAGDHQKASRVLERIASHDTGEHTKLLSRIFSGVPSNNLVLSLDAKLFIARLFLEEKNVLCACETYRSSIDDLFDKTLEELTEADVYTRNMLILGRYLDRCHESSSVVLMRSILAIAKDVAYKGYQQLSKGESETPPSYAMRGIALWLDNKFDLAYAEFSKAAELGEDYGFLEARSPFMAQYSAYSDYQNSEVRLKELKDRIRTLTLELQRSLGDKDLAWSEALSFDAIDLALFVLEKSGEKSINRAAGSLGLALTLKDAIDLYRSIERVTAIRRDLETTELSTDREVLRLEKLEKRMKSEMAHEKIVFRDLERVLTDLRRGASSLDLYGCFE